MFLAQIFILIFCKWSYSQRCFDVPNVAEIDAQNDNVVSIVEWQSLYNVVQINHEIDKVDSMLSNVANSNVDVHNVVSTLIWGCPTSRRHINLLTTLKQHWNVCWGWVTKLVKPYFLALSLISRLFHPASSFFGEMELN